MRGSQHFLATAAQALHDPFGDIETPPVAGEFSDPLAPSTHRSAPLDCRHRRCERCTFRLPCCLRSHC